MAELDKPALKPCWCPDSDKPFKADAWLGFTALVWEMSEGNHGKLASVLSGSAAQALAASLSLTLGSQELCIRTSFKVTTVGFVLQFCARSEFKRQLPG